MLSHGVGRQYNSRHLLGVQVVACFIPSHHAITIRLSKDKMKDWILFFRKLIFAFRMRCWMLAARWTAAARLTWTGGTGGRGPAQQKLAGIRCCVSFCVRSPWTCTEKLWGLMGNRSCLSSYSQSVQVHHRHLCHQGDHLDPKKEEETNKQEYLGYE